MNESKANTSPPGRTDPAPHTRTFSPSGWSGKTSTPKPGSRGARGLTGQHPLPFPTQRHQGPRPHPHLPILPGHLPIRRARSSPRSWCSSDHSCAPLFCSTSRLAPRRLSVPPLHPCTYVGSDISWIVGRRSPSSGCMGKSRPLRSRLRRGLQPGCSCGGSGHSLIPAEMGQKDEGRKARDTRGSGLEGRDR
jgi:hypothetical protein